MDGNLIKIYESEGIEKIWLQEMLEDENIPYEAVFEEYWTGIKAGKYHVKQCIFVDARFKKSVMGFIDEYNSADFVIHEDDALCGDFENVLPQITCPACGKKID